MHAKNAKTSAAIPDSGFPYAGTIIRSDISMLITAIAFLPLLIFGAWTGGIRVLEVFGISFLSFAAVETIAGIIFRGKCSLSDCSALVSALIIALILPPSVPLLIAAAAAATGSLVKNITGGLGRNFLNPALISLIFVGFYSPGILYNFQWNSYGEVTPLEMLSQPEAEISVSSLLTGRVVSPTGTSCILLIFLAALILLITGISDEAVGITASLVFGALQLVWGGHGLDTSYICVQLMSGSFLFTAFIMGADPVTTPVRHEGRVIEGILMGITVFLLRRYGIMAEYASFAALLFCNFMVRPIDAVTCSPGVGSVHVRTLNNTDSEFRRNNNDRDSLQEHQI